MSWTRRRFLSQGAKLALVIPPLGWGLGCSDSCVDLDLLSTGQISLRESFEFTERSPHGSEKDCVGCEFFTAGSGEGAACGTCRLLNGPVHPRGYCDGWSERA